MDQNLKKRIFGILEPRGTDSRLFDFFIITLIILNIIAFTLETIPEISKNHNLSFEYFEIFSIVVFSIEYILRVWTCDLGKDFKNPIMDRFRYMLTPFALIDLMAILPFYLPMVQPNLIFIRGIRLLRIFRVLKLTRYAESARILGKVIRGKSSFLAVLFFTNLIMLVLTSGAMYLAEHDAQPEVFTNMLTSFWFGIETLSGIGYGDMIPQTPLGRIFGFIILTLGVEMYVIPVGIITSGLIEEFTKEKCEVICPHCNQTTAAHPRSRAAGYARRRRIKMVLIRSQPFLSRTRMHFIPAAELRGITDK
jgi:voltage-gated potassium channel